MATHYETLGVAKNASVDNINKAFRKLALKHHPNKGGDAEEFKRLSSAHDILEDPELRKEYNATLDTAAPSSPFGASPSSPSGASPTTAEPTKDEIMGMSKDEVLAYLRNATNLEKETLTGIIDRAEALDLFHYKEYEKALKIYRKRSNSSRRPNSSRGANSSRRANNTLSKDDEELLQHLNNTRHTVVPNTRNDLRNLILEAESRGLTKHRRYKKAVEKLGKLRKTRRRR